MRAYHIGGARAEPANLYRTVYGYGCTAASKSAGAAYFDLGAEIPASSLVGRNIVVQ